MTQSRTGRRGMWARAGVVAATLALTPSACGHRLQAERLRGDLRVADVKQGELEARLGEAIEGLRRAQETQEEAEKRAAGLAVELASALAAKSRLEQENVALRQDKVRLEKLIDRLLDQLKALSKNMPRRCRDLLSDIIRATREGVRMVVDNTDKVQGRP